MYVAITDSSKIATPLPLTGELTAPSVKTTLLSRVVVSEKEPAEKSLFSPIELSTFCVASSLLKELLLNNFCFLVRFFCIPGLLA